MFAINWYYFRKANIGDRSRDSKYTVNEAEQVRIIESRGKLHMHGLHMQSLIDDTLRFHNTRFRAH